MKKIRVGIYIRVSTQEQAESGYSIHEQEERLKAYADANKWLVNKVYSDPGYSGAKLNRPALNEMITDIKLGKIQKVLVYKLDRLSRRQRDTLYLIEDVFNTNNVDFVSMTEQIDTGSPLGRAMIGILATFAQLEREQIRERMQIGLDARAKEGLWHGGGYDPIGYDYIDGQLVINDYEAMQIRKIYDMYLNGMSIIAIKHWLDDKGYKQKNREWMESAIRSVLTTELYVGRIMWKGNSYEGQHEAIIDKDTFDTVQQLKQQRYQAKPGTNGNPFHRTSMLGGLIWCGNCGARYYTKCNTVKRCKGTSPNKEPLRYYTCYSRGKSTKSLIKDPNCKNPSYNTQKLDEIILNEIKKLAIDEDYLNSLLDIDKPKTDILPIKKRIDEIENQIDKLIDLYQIGNIDFQMINDKIENLSNEKSKLEYELINAEDDKSVDIIEYSDIIKSVPEMLENGTDEQIKNIVHSLIDSIIIYDDAIKINWKFQ